MWCVPLDDADGGTPQRFSWLPAHDADMPDKADPEPAPWVWTRPHRSTLRPDGLVVLDVCEEARTTIEREHVRRNRGEGEALDGHLLLTRLKWAATLAVMDERLDVNDEDWRLAGVIIDLSQHTRGTIQAELRKAAEESDRARAIKEGKREVVRSEVVSVAAEQRVARNVMRKLAAGEASHADLRRALASRDRDWFDGAIERLVEAGQVGAERGPKGTTYRAIGGAA